MPKVEHDEGVVPDTPLANNQVEPMIPTENPEPQRPGETKMEYKNHIQAWVSGMFAAKSANESNENYQHRTLPTFADILLQSIFRILVYILGIF